MTISETESTIENESEVLLRKVAIQGYSGAFHEIAARLFFGTEEIAIAPSDTFSDLIKMVENGEVDTALMAIENSLAGSIMYNYNLLNDSKLKIVGEVYLRIKQNLMVLPGQKIEDLEEVHSHPVAIAQCREFFKQYPQIRLVETIDTALSAKLVRDQNLKNVGAIASTLAADLYDLEIIGSSIETNKLNYTRFLVLRRTETAEEVAAANKVSLCFSVEHEVGSLHKVLALMSSYNINLTKIQSAPIIGKQWEYMFFVDFVVKGKVSWQQALEAIKPLTTDLKVMGAYLYGEHFEY